MCMHKSSRPLSWNWTGNGATCEVSRVPRVTTRVEYSLVHDASCRWGMWRPREDVIENNNMANVHDHKKGLCA